MKTYTYDPSKIQENGKDRMRFELGDTMVEGEAETCALSDEEYTRSSLSIPTNGERPSWLCFQASCMASCTR